MSSTCTACAGAIVMQSVTANDGCVYHPDCFKCSECSESLLGTPFYKKNENLYCSAHYISKFCPDCFLCKSKITGKRFTVSGKIFHQDCFVCVSCNKSLNGVQLTLQNDSLYCVSCFQKKTSPICAGCHKPITSGQTLTIFGKVYHPGHIKCTKCFESIDTSDGSLFSLDNEPVCEQCHRSSTLPKCSKCEKTIDTAFIDLEGSLLHAACFACDKCNSALAGKSYYIHNSKILCEQDYLAEIGLNSAPASSRICAQCNKPLEGSAIQTEDSSGNIVFYHPSHFNCSSCFNPISVKSSFSMSLDGPKCPACVQKDTCKKCSKCNLLIISGNFVTIKNDHYHSNCWVCSECKAPVKGKYLLEEDGSPVCSSCATKGLEKLRGGSTSSSTTSSTSKPSPKPKRTINVPVQKHKLKYSPQRAPKKPITPSSTNSQKNRENFQDVPTPKYTLSHINDNPPASTSSSQKNKSNLPASRQRVAHLQKPKDPWNGKPPTWMKKNPKPKPKARKKP